MDVSIICVNWNSFDYLLDCIASIYEWTTGLTFEVIVVDNASPEGRIDTLKEYFPEILIVKSPTNLGFSGANNLGHEHARGEFLLFLNPDTRLISPAIETMWQTARAMPDAGVVGCRLLNSDRSVQTSSILRFPRLLDTFLQVEYLRLRWPSLWGIGPLLSSSDEPAAVEAISGACMLIRRTLFDAVGMFSRDYFMYSEDVDLCFKTVRSGFRNYYTGRGEVVHYGGKSSSTAWQTVAKTSAELLFCRKNYGGAYTLLFRMVSCVGALSRLAAIAGPHLILHQARVEQAWRRWTAILRTLVAGCDPGRPSSSALESTTP